MYYFKESPISDALRVFLRSMLEILPTCTFDKDAVQDATESARFV